MSQDHDEPAVHRGERGTREPAAPAAGPRRPLDAAARAQIGRGLRLHYAAVLGLPIPERLRTLIDDLAARSDTEASR